MSELPSSSIGKKVSSLSKTIEKKPPTWLVMYHDPARSERPVARAVLVAVEIDVVVVAGTLHGRCGQREYSLETN